MLLLFAAALTTSSALLFLVQPIVAKQVLPLLGAAPAIWNTCVLTFQIVLLAGYGYAYLSTTRLSIGRQVVLHALLLSVAFLALPIGFRTSWTPPTEVNPVRWLIGALLASVGLPFLVISATAPLLQRWFSLTRHRFASDPFFLYSASNGGSILGLLSYPLLLEPALRLKQQAAVWTVGYGVLAALAVICGAVAIRRPGTSASSEQTPAVDASLLRATSGSGAAAIADGPLTPGWGLRGRWVLLAAVPASLMLGVTTYLSTDIAAAPLLWVVPLVLYLLSFIAAFSLRSDLLTGVTSRALPLLVLSLILLLFTRSTLPGGVTIPLHLAAFMAAALACHLQLFTSRPSATYLTEFYFWISVGGVLGSVVNSIVAPVLFTEIAEYPLALVCAAALMPDREPGDSLWRAGAVRVALVAGLTLAVALIDRRIELNPRVLFVLLGLPALLAFSTVRRSRYFGAAVGAIAVIGVFHAAGYGAVIHRERTFFGVHHVVRDIGGAYHSLYHGTTLHGRQSLEAGRELEPLAYYHRSGPIGQVLTLFAGLHPKGRVGVVGLGAGALAAYAEPGQQWTFFELDPAVARIAQDPRYFTYLRHAAAPARIVLGDARQSLSRVAPQSFEVLVLDAFSSDAIPIHLMTREALTVYEQALTGDGLLAFHISNRHFNLAPVLGQLAEDQRYTALLRRDQVTIDASTKGASSSVWLVMARSPEALAPLRRDPRWVAPDGGSQTSLWTDDYSNIWSVFKGS